MQWNKKNISQSFKKKNISVREDNLPRFADRHDIKMAKKKREGSGGSVPTIYKIPSKAKLEEIKRQEKEKLN